MSYAELYSVSSTQDVTAHFLVLGVKPVFSGDFSHPREVRLEMVHLEVPREMVRGRRTSQRAPESPKASDVA